MSPGPWKVYLRLILRVNFILLFEVPLIIALIKCCMRQIGQIGQKNCWLNQSEWPVDCHTFAKVCQKTRHVGVMGGLMGKASLNGPQASLHIFVGYVK